MGTPGPLPRSRPRADRAATVRRLYEEVLETEGVDDAESFFALGGSSLLVVLLLELVGEKLGVEIPPEDFYREPTLAGLHKAIEARASSGVEGPDLTALLAEAAAAGPGRPAVVGPDGTLSYGELADLVTDADECPGAPEGWDILRMPTSVAGVRALLPRIAARRPLALLDPAATAEEERAARHALASGFPDVHGPERIGGLANVTSGSTGRPKVVVSPYDGMLAVQAAHAELHGLGPDDAYLVMAPLHYGYGLRAGLLVGLISGATVVLPQLPLTAESLRACAERHRVTMTMGVSFAYRVLLAAGVPLPDLRRGMVGGDPLPPAVVDAWEEWAPASLMDSYGCSETDHVSVNTDALRGSVGQPLPCVEVKVRCEDGTLAGSGVGELLVRSPGLALGYAGDPERTAESFHQGWYHTGDVAELRDDGHIALRGRLDDRINVAGAMVDAREVEQACLETLDVRDCAVVGVTGATGVIELRAYVVAERPVTRPDMARALSPRLSPHKIPSRVVPVDSLPRGANGKLRRQELPC